MSKKFCVPLCLSMAFLSACTSPTALPTLVPTLTPLLTPTPSPTPSATPTNTPIPPLVLTIHPPTSISPLRPAPIEVELVPPPGISVAASVHANVLSPNGAHYRSFDLQPAGDNRYVAQEPLQLPLHAEGDWQLSVIVQSRLRVSGERQVLFRPEPVRCRDLGEAVPSKVTLCVPQDFVEVAAQGDRVAGARVWRYGNGELGLWWAPGPAEPLLFNTALVMLEATFGLHAPAVQNVEEMAWQGRTAFLFHEDWAGAEGGPGEALVVQGPDRWLYVLRVRALDGGEIPVWLRMVRETFTFAQG